MRKLFWTISLERQGRENREPSGGCARGWWPGLAVVLAGWLVGFLAARAMPRGETAAATNAVAEISAPLRLAGLEPPAALPPQYRTSYEEARETVDRLAGTRTDVHVLTAAAILYRLAGDAAGEAVCWEKCLELDAANRQAPARLGEIALQDGQTAKAEKLMRDALARDPGVEDYRVLLARA